MVLQLEGEKYCFDRELLHYIRLQNTKKAHSMIQGCHPAELHDSSESTLLHYSAEYGNADMTTYFIERGCEIDEKNNDEFTPLMLAVKYRQEKTVKILLEADADIYPSRRSAGILLKDVIVWISWEGDFDEEQSPIRQGILKPILQKIKENLTTGDDQAIAQLLLESKCPLHHVICTLKDIGLTRYYLAKGYPVNTPESEMGRTPLHMAVSASDLANVEVLLEHGADVNKGDIDGRTVLFHYTKNGLDNNQLEILRILIKSGASLSLQDIFGVSAAERLLADAQKEVVNMILPYTDLTTRYGLKKNTVSHAIMRNTEIEDTDILKLLSEKYFDVNATNSDGATPLHFALFFKRPANIVHFILRKGADINAFYINMTTLKDMVTKSWKMPDNVSPCIKIIELFLLYGGDFRKELSTIKDTLNHRYFDKSCLAKLLIAHIVLQEENGYNFQELFVPSVEARPVLAKLFKKYKLQIEEMKLRKVYESITIFDLLAISDKKFVHYAANGDLISNFKALRQYRSYSKWYYYKYIRKRIARAVDVVKYQRKASLVISELTGIQQQLILDKIVDYLRISDFHGLFLAL